MTVSAGGSEIVYAGTGVMHRIGICDKNLSFAVGLADHINHEDPQYNAVIFSDKEAVAAYLTENDLELILTDDISGCKETGEGLNFHNVRCIYLSGRRSGNEPRIYAESDGGSMAPVSEREIVFKYQRLGDIYKEVRRSIAVSPPVVSKMLIEAVFSPLGRCGCTTLAMAMAEHTGGGRGIYVGMENYSPCKAPGGGILYQIKERLPGLAETVRGCVISSNGVDVLRAGTVYLDLRNVQKDDITCLSDCLLQLGKYDLVIYDLGSAVLEDPGILDCFDRIYMPVLDDPTSVGKLESFESILRSMELRSIMARIVKVHVPYYLTDEEEMAAFVRNLRYGKS